MITILKIEREKLKYYLDYYISRNYRCTIKPGHVECTKQINEVQTHKVIMYW